jgi:hypothetical protein
MFNMLALNPQLMAVIDPTKATKRYLIINEEDPKAWMRDSGKTVEDWQKLAMHENIIMAVGTPLDPTENATAEHTAVHLDYMNSSDFEALDPGIKKIFEYHALGEHENNPSTGSIADADAGIEDPGAESLGGGGVGGGATSTEVPVADIQPSTVGGTENRDAQQEAL